MNSPVRSARRSPSPGGITGRALAIGALVIVATAFTASPASAAAPSNDEVDGASAVTLGEHVTLDTTQATTSATDGDLNDACGAPETKASVWYSYTAAADGGVVLDMTGSDYSGGFLVFEATPSVDSLITCGQGVVGFATAAGTTYTIMVIDDDDDGDTANGGSLELDVNEAGPPPTLEVRVDPKATVDKSGTAWVTGSYSCTGSDFVELDGELHQDVGRVTIDGYGFFFDEGTCDGSSNTFSMAITGTNGKFAGGKSASIVFSYACGAFDCVDGYAEQTVQLTKGKGH